MRTRHEPRGTTVASRLCIQLQCNIFLCSILQRALVVLGHQKRFLTEHKTALEAWASDVYGARLAKLDPVSIKETSSESQAESLNDRKQTERPEQYEPAETSLREIRVSVKCKGGDKRRVEKVLVAHVRAAWYPRRVESPEKRSKRAPCQIMAEKPPKRSKVSATKLEEPNLPCSEEHEEEELMDEESTDEFIAPSDVPQTPGQIWSWLEDCSFFAPISRRQPLSEDLTLEAGYRMRRSMLVPLQCASEPTRRAAGNPGTVN